MVIEEVIDCVSDITLKLANSKVLTTFFDGKGVKINKFVELLRQKLKKTNFN